MELLITVIIVLIAGSLTLLIWKYSSRVKRHHIVEAKDNMKAGVKKRQALILKIIVVIVVCSITLFLTNTQIKKVGKNAYINNFEEFVEKVKVNHKEYSADDWIKIDKEYQEFEDAKKLITATKYKEAFDALDKFVVNYPSSELLPEAKYNLGYTQFALRNYKAAINTFNKIVLEYPDNPIAPNSLYQVSNSQIQLTRITKAKQTLRTLIKKYPNADIIPSAKKRLKDLESIKL